MGKQSTRAPIGPPHFLVLALLLAMAAAVNLLRHPRIHWGWARTVHSAKRARRIEPSRCSHANTARARAARTKALWRLRIISRPGPMISLGHAEGLGR
jgi:hypothetical protein